VIAGPVRQREETLMLDLDLRTVAAERRLMDPVGHYNRPDVFRLLVDTSPRPAVVETSGVPANSVAASLAARTCEPTEA
jgi:nitrilase